MEIHTPCCDTENRSLIATDGQHRDPRQQGRCPAAILQGFERFPHFKA